MADLVIGDYDAAVTIDGATHYLLIQPGNASTAYKKITRDVYLGVTGQPADISTAQSLTNKTLDNTNIVTLRDDRFTLQDSGDTTKQAQFQLSGITTATTRTYTLPDRSDTLVDLGSTQTLTSKTLTAPTINNGSITGTTITTDAIVGQSSANSGTIYGLSISSAKVGTNGVIAGSITDAAVTPVKLVAGLGSSWVWQSWTPAWTNLTVSGSTVTARYTQIGKSVFFRIAVVLANGNVPSGSVSFTLPVTAVAHAGTASLPPLGQAIYFDSGTASYDGFVSFNSTTTAVLYVMATGSTYATTTSLSSTVPFTWGNTDEFLIQGYYEAS